MKMNIQIIKNDKKIVEIEINNGNWKYWDNLIENGEKTSLTINTIYKSRYLSQPVKDAYPFYDHEAVINSNELIVTDAMVRTYDSLIDYLNHRINNCKEEYKKYGWTESDFTIVLYDLRTKKFREDATSDIIYEKQGLCEVKITIGE